MRVLVLILSMVVSVASFAGGNGGGGGVRSGIQKDNSRAGNLKVGNGGGTMRNNGSTGTKRVIGFGTMKDNSQVGTL